MYSCVCMNVYENGHAFAISIGLVEHDLVIADCISAKCQTIFLFGVKLSPITSYSTWSIKKFWYKKN